MIKNRPYKSSKGALIKGMTKRLPIEILNNEIFQKRLKEIMKGYAGIYAMYRKDKLYYVGLTTNLFGRLKTHRIRDRHAGKWDEFIIFRIKKVNYLKDIETLLTHLVNVKGNRVSMGIVVVAFFSVFFSEQEIKRSKVRSVNANDFMDNFINGFIWFECTKIKQFKALLFYGGSDLLAGW